MAREFPDNRTAFVVIHGVGEQNPFETLDSFTRGLVGLLTSQGFAFTAEHKIVERRDAQGSPWTESYVQLAPPHGKSLIAIHEYYWAYLTEEKITVAEVGEWVEQTLAGTKRFYRENEELAGRYEKEGKVRFHLERVARDLAWIGRVYPFAKAAIALLGLVCRYAPLSSFKGTIDWLEERLRPLIVGYLGDIAIYTTTDEKSRYYRLRKQILTQAQTLLEAILADAQYDRVIIAGHSLGSVIAYDTLDRLNIKAHLAGGVGLPLDKLQGLITFGSPLDKIAFFFREHAGKEQWVRRQIMEHLHSFKSRPLSFDRNDFPLANPITPKLDRIPWVNYYADNDPISGHLDYYTISDADNVVLQLPEPWGKAHVGYWQHRPFYEDIARRFLR